MYMRWKYRTEVISFSRSQRKYVNPNGMVGRVLLKIAVVALHQNWSSKKNCNPFCRRTRNLGELHNQCLCRTFQNTMFENQSLLQLLLEMMWDIIFDLLWIVATTVKIGDKVEIQSWHLHRCKTRNYFIFYCGYVEIQNVGATSFVSYRFLQKLSKQ